MRIDSTDNTRFAGNFLVSKNVGKKNAKYIDRIINKSINGVTNKQLLDKQTFDVVITGVKKDKSGQPHLGVSSSFRALNLAYDSYKVREKSQIPLNQSVRQGAEQLREHIQNVDFKKRVYSGFNTVGEKVKSFVLMMLRIY